MNNDDEESRTKVEENRRQPLRNPEYVALPNQVDVELFSSSEGVPFHTLA